MTLTQIRGGRLVVAATKSAAAAVAVLAVATWAAGCVPAALDGTPAFQPPPVTVLTQGARNDNCAIFVTPGGGGSPSGPEIPSPAGKVIWFRPLPPGELATDFRTQSYRGRPVLTWCQGKGHGTQLKWTDYVYNDKY